MRNVIRTDFDIKVFFPAVYFFLTFVIISGCGSSPKTAIGFFNARDLSGWSASNMQFWSVEDSAIVGRAGEELKRNQFLWSAVKVKNFYLSVDVRLDSIDRNAGIQFRATKVDESGQAKGYQADIGVNWGENIWGTLYYEDGRGLLQSSDPAKSPVKDQQWNHYEILASGNRIWIAVNGIVISATDDKGGDTEGFIALQIHAGPAQTVRYRINRLVHDPAISLAGKNEMELNGILHKPLVGVENEQVINLKSNDVIAFAGGSTMASMMEDGYLETLLTAQFTRSALKFRNVSWDGDQVSEQFRDAGFQEWARSLDSLNANKIFVQFGQMESLQGKEKLPEFIELYKKLLGGIRKKGREIIILSPTRFEPGLLAIDDSAQWNNPLDSTDIQKYCQAIQLMAQMENYLYVDLYWPSRDERNPVTYDGIHLHEQGRRFAAGIIMKTLSLDRKYTLELDPLRAQVNTKNKIWFDYWRPGNWAFLNGDRTEQAFSHHWKDGGNRIFPEEMKRFQPLLDEAEKKIRQLQKELADGQKLAPLNPDAEKEVPSALPVNDSSIAEELSSFKLDDNYKIELFASESLGIADPCAMRWDEKGRLWVLCIPTYPQQVPGHPANDKLVVLADNNNDGRADSSYVFADGLNVPIGFELGHNGVYLGEQTRMLFLKDTNNDGRSDSRQTLFSGFGTHDSHQTINSFTWSPGGELFFAQGLSIHSSVETPWGVKKAHRGGIWRYRPVSHQLENILDQNTASDNPWGITFGDYGELFSKSNDIWVYYISPALVLTDHKAPVPNLGATVIKSGIVEIPRSAHLPDVMRSTFLIAGYYNNKVERMRVTESGAGYKATLIEPLLTSTSKNFRPVDIKTGPDGAIYILDWYNPIIGHYQASMRDPQRDKTHGRVWRITARNRPLAPRVKLDNQTTPDLINFLNSDEYWVRYQVRRLLASRVSGDVLPAVTEWIKKLDPSRPKFERKLMEAIAVYENFERINMPLLKKLLKAKDPGVRGYAAQLTGRWSERLDNPLDLIAPLLSDANARVRVMALVACSNMHQPEAMSVASTVLDYPGDKFISYAFEKTVFALRDYWEPAYRNNTTGFRKKQHLAAVIGLLAPEWFTAKMYRELFGSEEFTPEIKTRLLSGLFDIGSPEDIEYILNLSFAQKNVVLLNEMANKQSKQVTEGSVLAIKKILTSRPGKEITLASFRMINSWRIHSLSTLIRNIILSDGQDQQVVAAGINAVVDLDGREATPVLDKFSVGNYSKAVRMSCVRGYAKTDIKRGADEIVKEIKRGTGDVNEMRETLIAIIYEPGGIEALTTELQRTRLDGTLASAAVIALGQRHINDPALLKTISRFEIKKENAIPKEYNPEFVEKLAARVKMSGKTLNGKQVYENNLTCFACHKLSNKGGNIGPDLSSVGSGLTLTDIITEVIWPNKNIKEGFYSIKLELKNGETIQGIKALENVETISLKNTLSSVPVIINKKEINKITGIGSAMPEGLVNAISEKELVDLIKYLSEQKNK